MVKVDNKLPGTSPLPETESVLDTITTEQPATTSEAPSQIDIRESDPKPRGYTGATQATIASPLEPKRVVSATKPASPTGSAWVDMLARRLGRRLQRLEQEPNAHRPTVQGIGTTFGVNVVSLDTATALTEARRSFDAQLESAGLQPLWIAGQGTLDAWGAAGRSPEQAGKHSYVGWQVGKPLQFKLELPAPYSVVSGPQTDHAKAALDALYQPPLTGEQALKMPSGSELVLTGEGFYGQEGKSDRSATDDPEHAVELRVERLAGSSARVTLTRRVLDDDFSVARLAGRLSADTSLGGVGALGIDTELNRRHSDVFVLDLADPKARRVYEQLLALDVDSVEASLEPAGTAVRQVKEDERGQSPYKLALKAFGEASAPLVPNSLFGLGVEMWERRIPADDAAILGDKHRAQYTAAMREAGKELSWIETGGILEPRWSTVTGLPLAGASVQAGMQLGGVLRYNVLSAHTGGMSERSKEAFDQAVKLAVLDPAKLADPSIPPGTEIAYQGIGALRALLRQGAGFDNEASFGFELAATAGAEAYREKLGELAVVLKKLSDGRIVVSVGEMEQQTDAASARAKVGLDFDSVEALRHYDGSSVVADWLDNKLAKPLKKLVERPLEKILTAEASAGKATTMREQSLRRFGPLDPADPEQMASLRDLLSLRRHGEASSLPKLFDYVEKAESGGSSAQLRLFSRTAFLQRMMQQKLQGTLTTPEGRLDFTENEIQQSSKFFKSRDAEWEAVTYRTDMLEGGQGTFFHLSLQGRDPFTSGAEVKDFQTMFAALHAELASPAKVNRATGLKGLFTKHGSTEQRMDLWFTDVGLARAAEGDEEKARRTFMEVAGRFEPEAASPPWLDAAHEGDVRQMIERYWELWPRSSMQSEGDEQLDELIRDYRHRYKRDLAIDAVHLRQADIFGEAIGRMHGRSMNDPADVQALLEDLVSLGESALAGGAEKEGDRFLWRVLATLGVLAGPDEVLVNELSMTGKRIDIRAQSEGQLLHPRQVVGRALKE